MWAATKGEIMREHLWEILLWGTQCVFNLRGEKKGVGSLTVSLSDRWKEERKRVTDNRGV